MQSPRGEPRTRRGTRKGEVMVSDSFYRKCLELANLQRQEVHWGSLRLGELEGAPCGAGHTFRD